MFYYLFQLISLAFIIARVSTDSLKPTMIPMEVVWYQASSAYRNGFRYYEYQ